MRKRRHQTCKTTEATAGHGSFQLPPDVSFEKERLSCGWAYVFRHRTLGRLGRIVLEGRDDGRTQVSCELAGDPADPMTDTRRGILEPLALELTRRVDEATGPPLPVSA
ncbi:MAG: hypothetical protein ACRD18_08645 [Terriglobia bacterium]